MPSKEYRKPLTDEARERHRAYVTQHIPCPACSHPVMRANMTKHKKSLKHQQWMEANPDWTPPPRKKKTCMKEQLEHTRKTLAELVAIIKR